MPDQAWREEELRARGLLFPALRLRLPPLVTSDMVAEREAALAALGAPAAPCCLPNLATNRRMHASLGPARVACSCVITSAEDLA